MPCVLVAGERSPDGDVVDMQVIIKGAAPPVKDAEKPGELTTHIRVVGSRLFERFGGSSERRTNPMRELPRLDKNILTVSALNEDTKIWKTWSTSHNPSLTGAEIRR